MKYIKTYERYWHQENPERTIEVGDVIKMNSNPNYYGTDFAEFAANHIAKVTYICIKHDEYYIKFIPNENDKPHSAYFDNRNYFKDPKVIEPHEVEISAKNIEELETIMNTIKYNL